jgi:hypothetical protein
VWHCGVREQKRTIEQVFAAASPHC